MRKIYESWRIYFATFLLHYLTSKGKKVAQLSACHTSYVQAPRLLVGLCSALKEKKDSIIAREMEWL